MIRTALIAILTLASGCARFHSEQAGYFPVLSMERLTTGQLDGMRVVLNTNEQVVRSGSATLICKSTGPRSAECAEKVTFSPVAIGAADEVRESQFEYDFTMQDAGPVKVTRKSASGQQEGTSFGSVLDVRGKMPVPFSDKTASVETRIHAIASGDTYYQVDIYTEGGFESGRIVTIWNRKK
jgi:beta-xylosidase